MRVQRVDPVDSLTRDGLTLNLYDRQLVLLSVLGAEVFAATSEPIELGDLAERLVAVLGVPEGISPLDVTTHSVTDLLRQGVLVEVEP